MERSEISLHEVKILRVFKQSPQKWLTHKGIAQAGNLNERTVRAHTLRFVKLGILDRAELFPEHRYRLSEKADKRNVSYVQRLNEADQVFGEQV